MIESKSSVNEMIVLLGGSGYVGEAFRRTLLRRGLPFIAPSHAELEASSKEAVYRLVQSVRPRFVINAIGFTGRPNIDGTEREKLRCLSANAIVPGTLAEVFTDTAVPWGHVSSGCIYDGSRSDGSPFTEEDSPNFAFGHSAASWYSRTKAMAEIMLRDAPNCTIWRLRIPFDQYDNERNYLSKIMRYETLLEVTNSISQLQEFTERALETLLLGIPPGIYNVTNPGSIRTSEVAEAIRRHGLCQKRFRFFRDEREFLTPGRVKRANCLLSSEKLARAGLPLREIHDALEWTLRHWQWKE